MSRRRNKEYDDAPKPKLTQESIKEAMKAFEFIRPYRWSFFGGMFLLFLSSLVFMIFPRIIGELVDIAQGNSQFNLTLKEMGLWMVGILLVQGVVSYVRVLLFANVSEKGIADVRKSLYQKLVSLPISFFEENKLGDLISRLTGDVEKLHSAFSITLAEFFRQVIIIVVGIGLLIFTAPRLSLVMLLTIPVVALSAVFFGKYIRKLSKERQKKLAESNALASESIQNIQVVKAFVNELFEVNRYFKTISDVVKISISYAKGRALFAVFIIIIMFGALFFILWQGAMMLQAGDITAGQLVSFVTYTFIIVASFASLANFGPELLGAMGATERVRQILAQEGEIDLDANPEVKPIKIEGNIRYENVHFHYPTRTDVPVLKGINLEIKAGQKVALVGPSGVGKSTVVQLLLRFYDLIEGDIKVDGKSIYDFNLRDFRNNLALVPQEVILFGGTIRENILYGKADATEEEVIQAAHQSNSWEFIQSFPDGLNTVIGERGVKLSGGQRQRIAIARAILKNPAILLLDEATSSLDSESEKVVQDALEKLMEGRTSIIIAHRFTTIREVDCIYVLDGGKVVEKGTHEELTLLDGKYNSLANMQFENI
ncbi:MAG TPA: ATP-binding cassette domain-containing protein [Bacteroidetes bacterium]|nr:ATP-binding cassette domain-containing protein [Bacteroidota bacterium]